MGLTIPKLARGLLIVLGLAIAGILSMIFLAWQPALPGIEPPSADQFDTQSIQSGAILSAVGGCGECHTAPGGSPFAGGRALETPFGTIYSTNITPNAESGIGRWSRAAFLRAMRAGIDREGRQLYPAFPYDHFTKITLLDDDRLYAYLMTRPAIRAQVTANEIRFPFNLRWLIAPWKWLFFREGDYRADPTHDELWNRGAYLVNGLGHCGSCHTSRNRLGAERSGQRLDGGAAEGWRAYALDHSSPAALPWNLQSLQAYFRDGWQADHGVAHGPMGPIAESLAALPNEEISAIATYIAWSMSGREPAVRRPAAEEHASDATAKQAAVDGSATEGSAIYAATCEGCHDGSRPLPFGGIRLTLSSATTDPSATNLIRVVLDGLHPPEGTTGALMPGFAHALSDSQLESLLQYIRGPLAGAPPWPDLAAQVHEAQKPGP